jgi:hypothetical protein
MSLATKRSASSCRTSASTGDRGAGIADLLGLLRRLDAAGIACRLEQPRANAVCLQVAVPGERWEIELLESGELEIEIFRSNGEIRDAEALDDLFARFSG